MRPSVPGGRREEGSGTSPSLTPPRTPRSSLQVKSDKNLTLGSTHPSWTTLTGSGGTENPSEDPPGSRTGNAHRYPSVGRPGVKQRVQGPSCVCWRHVVSQGPGRRRGETRVGDLPLAATGSGTSPRPETDETPVFSDFVDPRHPAPVRGVGGDPHGHHVPPRDTDGPESGVWWPEWSLVSLYCECG